MLDTTCQNSCCVMKASLTTGIKNLFATVIAKPSDHKLHFSFAADKVPLPKFRLSYSTPGNLLRQQAGMMPSLVVHMGDLKWERTVQYHNSLSDKRSKHCVTVIPPCCCVF
eukprot:TRINITY_DN57313_c0_g1_i1.p1 TRINITY_DN57313_c0_g1~~TRINITY_DN57313_c0_g1_i1.p1  ORF type:complete len:111 (+),score=10.02 TRINITY_DN57313_c0_g1_i1:19-351(+)